MKKFFVLFLLCLICLQAAGCADSEFTPVQIGAKNDDPEAAVSVQRAYRDVTRPEAGRIDVDLTELSSTMVYAEVFSIMSNPEEYVGKTIKMRGICSCPDAYSHYVIIEDAAACCQQGIEFALADPDGYPQNYERVEVVGVFSSYSISIGTMSHDYYYIAADDISIG